MKTTLLKFALVGIFFLIAFGLTLNPLTSLAQESTAQDTVESVQDNSSSFNDSVQFDDMEPIFYEATEEDEVAPDSGNSGIIIYVGIAVVLLVILIVLKKVGKKKA